MWIFKKKNTVCCSQFPLQTSIFKKKFILSFFLKYSHPSLTIFTKLLFYWKLYPVNIRLKLKTWFQISFKIVFWFILIHLYNLITFFFSETHKKLYFLINLMQLWKNFFSRFGKKITRVPVVKHRNDIKIQIVHPSSHQYSKRSLWLKF